MEYQGYSVYDDDSFFDKYMARRSRNNSPNALIEKPIILTLIGDVKGKTLLDLGNDRRVFPQLKAGRILH
ncbi:hypothetical protein [Peribacillus cavernae]|uniref:hypothetical protein n=1 Tax=Peribacillus cavernae TaxID=1674310 RepID=UPI0026860B03|nr:hypothetical protein [Peribacillus cavernae]MDQ0218820.1 hypothetical protein [Peribacillus cavernae]